MIVIIQENDHKYLIANWILIFCSRRMIVIILIMIVII